MASHEAWLLENGNSIKFLSKEMRSGRTAHNVSSSSLRKKSDLALLSGIRAGFLRSFLGNLQQVLLGTKLSVFFLAIPFAIAAKCRRFGSGWVFGLSCAGLVPLAERISFLTEQIALFTGPTAGGLLNATCGNATELIIAIFALIHNQVDVVKYSLLGSILSNLLLVLGSSLLCGGIANFSKQQKFEKKQAEVNSLLLLLGLVCHVLPLILKCVGASNEEVTVLALSRATCLIMLAAYIAYLSFQILTHPHFFKDEDADDDDDDGGNVESVEMEAIGLWSAVIWLLLMTAVVALLSEYVVDTIEAASNEWRLSVGFTSIILLPIVGNAVEHAGAIIFAFRNKLDITLGVALGSATQISMFVVPLSVVISWIIGVKMDLDFGVVETVALSLSILLTAFTLQDGSSHYLKGLLLLLCYLVFGACFFVLRPVKK